MKARLCSLPPFAFLCLAVPCAQAQLPLGQIHGRALSTDTGRPLSGVTVTASGPALLGRRTTTTTASGQFLLTQLPPGDGYTVRCEQPGISAEVGEVRVSLAETRTVLCRLGQRSRATRSDLAEGAAVRTSISADFIGNVAVRGRTYDGLLALAPGVFEAPRGMGGDAGPSLVGSTGLENAYLIDGVNTTDPREGRIGSQPHQYFLQELQVWHAGLTPEYGRTTGGLVTAVTRPAGSVFHGGVYLSAAPLQLGATPVARLGEAVAARRNLGGEYDIAFDLGGPIWRDRLAFYVGLAATFSELRDQRIVRRQSFDPALGKARSDPNYECPGYLTDPLFCEGARGVALETTELVQRGVTLEQPRRHYSWVTKLAFVPAAGHQFTLSYNGAPEKSKEHSGLRNDLAAGRYEVTTQMHDLSLSYAGQLRWLRVEAAYNLHIQEREDTPEIADRPLILYRAPPNNPYSLADFEAIDECRRQPVGGGQMSVFNPCPITSYGRNGFGRYGRIALSRQSGALGLSAVFEGLGLHTLRLGFEVEGLGLDHLQWYSGVDGDSLNGHRIYRTNLAGTSLQIYREFAMRGGMGRTCQSLASATCLDSFQSQGQGRNYALFLRHIYRPSFVPGLTLDLGVRWDAQQIFTADGAQAISLYDNVAPRLGASYDVVGRGRVKLLVNFARLYESLLLNVADRLFSGEGNLSTSYTSTCNVAAQQPAGRSVPVPEPAPMRPCTFASGSVSGGGTGTDAVLPGVRGQYVDEVAAGVQADIGLDVLVGVTYIHRGLGRIIDDFSSNAAFYGFGNPGEAPDPAQLAALDLNAEVLTRLAAESPQDQALQDQAQKAAGRAAAYRGAAAFPRPRRDYDALQISVQKRLSSRFALLLSYTYSRSLGNYTGGYSASTGQAEPNLSTQYDLVELLANREGPLPTDRPHHVKLSGLYAQPIGGRVSLIAGLTFSGLSGRPIDVLGFQGGYGSREVFILPRGAGGRTPFITQVDAHLGVDVKLSRLVNLNIYADAVNLFNQQAVLNVDDEYTASVVGPILGGQPDDLRLLRDQNGQPIVRNTNYGQPTAYQTPLLFRTGARLVF